MNYNKQYCKYDNEFDVTIPIKVIVKLLVGCNKHIYYQ